MDEKAQPTDERSPVDSTVANTDTSEVVNANPQQPTPEEKLDEVEREMSSFERSTLRWTKATFLILAVTCIFIGFQGYEMLSDSRDTHDLAVAAKTQADRMKDFAGRMKDQADQTREIAGISKDELVDVRRAFISVTSLDPKVIPNGAYTWTLTVENSGSTNAQHLEMRRNCGTPRSLGINWLDFLDFSKHLLPPQSLEIGPHSKQTLGFCAAVPSLVDGPDRPWIMFGEFTYADIFGENHLTEFCYQSWGYGAMIPCEGINSRHNCTDQDCEDFKKTTAFLKKRTVKKPN